MDEEQWEKLVKDICVTKSGCWVHNLEERLLVGYSQELLDKLIEEALWNMTVGETNIFLRKLGK